MRTRQQRAFTTLRGFSAQRAPRERCDVCGAEVQSDHAHLFEPASRQLICACDECAVTVGDQAGTPYRRVPRQVRTLLDFRLDDARWDGLTIPVGMAFFFHSTPAGRVLAFYPSPAGATESLLSLEEWADVVRDNPPLETMQPDVEALLVNRMDGARDYYLVPIDRCYELVGLMRTHWRGLSGGSEVWEQIQGFYGRLRGQADGPEARTHA